MQGRRTSKNVSEAEFEKQQVKQEVISLKDELYTLQAQTELQSKEHEAKVMLAQLAEFQNFVCDVCRLCLSHIWKKLYSSELKTTAFFLNNDFGSKLFQYEKLD